MTKIERKRRRSRNPGGIRVDSRPQSQSCEIFTLQLTSLYIKPPTTNHQHSGHHHSSQRQFIDIVLLSTLPRTRPQARNLTAPPNRRLRHIISSGHSLRHTTPTMKVFSSTSHFDYDWEHVSTANWQKYSPWNEKSTHVIAVDTLSRHVDASTGIVR